MMCLISDQQFAALDKFIKWAESADAIPADENDRSFQEAKKALAEIQKEHDEQNDEYHKAVREYARDRKHKDESREIDSDAIVSAGADDGAYIMAWTWIPGVDLREYLGEASCDSCDGPIEGSPEDDDDVEQLCEECQKEANKEGG